MRFPGASFVFEAAPRRADFPCAGRRDRRSRVPGTVCVPGAARVLIPTGANRSRDDRCNCMSASSSGSDASPPPMRKATGHTSVSDASVPVTSPAKILIVEPHPVRRESAAFLIDRQADLAACGSATSIAEAEEMLQIVVPDLVVVNLGARPQAGDAKKIRALRTAHPSLPLLTVVRPPASPAPGSLVQNLPGSAWSICRVPADLLASVRQTLIEGSSFRTARAAA